MSLRTAADTAQAAGLRLRRAIPRRPGHLLIEVVDERGTSIAGQWFDDPAEAAKVARGTGRAEVPDAVRLATETMQVQLLAGRLLLQPGGADRRLPALRRLLTEPDSTLMAHRPERRGVVRRRPGVDWPDGQGQTRRGTSQPPTGTDSASTSRADKVQTYSKVVRPDKIGGVLAGLAGGRASGLRTPRVVDVDLDAGMVTTSALPGRTLHELLTTGTERSPDQWWHTGVAVGDSLGRLHRGAIGGAVPTHDAAAELGVCRRWIDLAAAHGLLDAADPALTQGWASAVGGVDSGRVLLAPIHRDLHDKQLLVDAGGGIGVLDLDLLAAGDPALDLANLLVHLELRVRQGVTDRVNAAACAAGLLVGHRAHQQRGDGYGSIPGYAWATRLRLLAVYAFRPASAAAARTLVTDPDPLIEDYR